MVVLIALGAIGLWAGWRLARALVTLAALAFLAIMVLPVGHWVFAPLENRFPQPPLPTHIDGIVLLGGAVSLPVTQAHGEVALTVVGERIVATMMLAHHYPDVPVVLTGGDASFRRTELPMPKRRARRWSPPGSIRIGCWSRVAPATPGRTRSTPSKWRRRSRDKSGCS